MRVDYPNDRWFGSAGFTEIQPNHNPAIGFTPRRGFRAYSGQAGFGPRPDAHPWFRQFTFDIGANFLTDMEDRLVTRDVSLRLLGVQFQSQDNFNVTMTPTFEGLEGDFEIHPGVVLSEGSDYSFTRYRFDLGTANRRILSTRSSFGFGDFFSGTREEVILSLGVRPFVGMVANLSTEWNRIHLPEGEFQTRLYRLNVGQPVQPVDLRCEQRPVRLGKRPARLADSFQMDDRSRKRPLHHLYAELSGRHPGESFSDAGSTRGREIRLYLPVVSPRVAPLWWATVRTRGHTAHGEAT